MNCPICHQNKLKKLLTLPKSPIYQNPVSSPKTIKPPYFIHIEYQYCVNCGHAFRKDFDSDLLDEIYTNHYYTANNDKICQQFINDFIETTNQIFNNIEMHSNILEIGSSNGDLLSKILNNNINLNVVGYEPCKETAEEASKKGIFTKNDFFNEETAKNEVTYDVIISRHVIEHILNPDSFFKSINIASHGESILILETPSIGWAMATPSITSFHIQHAHVFSAFSLSYLAERYGWKNYFMNINNNSGNMILAFKKHIKKTIKHSVPPFDNKIQESILKTKNELIKKLAGKKIILWGAGSAGLSIIVLYGIEPDIVVDGNFNKKGKKYCGYPWEIKFAPDVISAIVNDKNEDEYAVLIGSTFVDEIKKSLSDLHWNGTITSPFGKYHSDKLNYLGA